MLKIVSGKHKSRVLKSFKNSAIRPTSGFVREMIINLLRNPKFGKAEEFLSLNGKKSDLIEGAKFVDLFCGTGSIGLEMLSNGAKFACFVDKDKRSIERLQKNIEHLGEASTSKVLQADCTNLPYSDIQYDILFIDPPYQENREQNLITKTLSSLAHKNWLKNGSIIILEQAKKHDFTLPSEDFHILDKRKFSQTKIIILQYRAN